MRGLAWCLAIAAMLAVSACIGNHAQQNAIDSVSLRTVQLTRWKSGDNYARMSYPKVVGAAAAQLNPVIEHWMGAHCPEIGPKAHTYENAAACVNAIRAHCANLLAQTPSGPSFGCTLDSTAEVRIDAAGMLGITQKSYIYTGGAHGMTLIADLDLDLNRAHALELNDLLDHPDPKALTVALEQALRKQRHIPAGQTLKQAGFFVDQLPVPNTVLALPEGLLFTYQSYDIGPYVMGQPQALVPYAALPRMIRKNGPLTRLHDLLRPSG